MVRTPCCEKMGLKKGPWTKEEDEILVDYINRHGHGNWRALPKQAGLLRCGKSCRLRWINYLRPDIKRGNFSHEEEDAIIKLHQALGNRWSVIAARLPGRTDNEIKNIWHTRIKKRLNDYGLVTPQPRLKIKSEPLKTLDDTDFLNSSLLMTANSPPHSSTTTSTDVHASSYSISSDGVVSDTVFPNDLSEVDESFWSQVFSSENLNDAGEMPATVDGGNRFDSVENKTYETKSSIEFWDGLFNKAEDLPVLPQL